MTLTDKLQQIISQSEEARSGPWFANHCGGGKSVDCWCMVVGTTPDPTLKEMDCIVSSGSARAADARFIASSRVLVPALARALGVAVEALEKCQDVWHPSFPNEVAKEALAEIEKLLEVK